MVAPQVAVRVCLAIAVVFCIVASARAERGPRALDLATRLHSREGDRALRDYIGRLERERAAGLRADGDFTLVTRRVMKPDPSRLRGIRKRHGLMPLWLELELKRMLYRVGAVIAQSIDAGGHVDLERVRALHGASIADFLAAVARAPEPSAGALAHLGDTAAPRLLDRLVETGQLDLPRMRALDALVAARGRTRPLAGFDVLARQHLLGTTLGLLQAFVDSGVEASSIDVLGKPYSEHPLVAHQMRHAGFRVMMAHQRFVAGKHAPGWLQKLDRDLENGHEPHSLAEAAFVERLSRAGKRMLIVDDGGNLIRWVNDMLLRHPELRGRVVAVEQTRRGVRMLRELDLQLPVIAVGDAWAKLEYEAPMIGRSVASEVHAYVEHLRRRGIEPGARVVILGYGVVGRATARALRRLGYRVEAWDKAWADRPEGRLDALADGVFPHRSRELALHRASILLSATGERAVGAADFARLPHGAVIFNGASPGEIDHAPLVAGATLTSFLGRPLHHLQPDARSARGFAVARVAGREILVAAKGDVINFGAVDPIPARYIQLTRGLLYLGALQAAGTLEPGLHALASSPQRRLVRAVRHELLLGGERLSNPMF